MQLRLPISVVFATLCKRFPCGTICLYWVFCKIGFKIILQCEKFFLDIYEICVYLIYMVSFTKQTVHVMSVYFLAMTILFETQQISAD